MISTTSIWSRKTLILGGKGIIDQWFREAFGRGVVIGGFFQNVIGWGHTIYSVLYCRSWSAQMCAAFCISSTEDINDRVRAKQKRRHGTEILHRLLRQMCGGWPISAETLSVQTTPLFVRTPKIQTSRCSVWFGYGTYQSPPNSNAAVICTALYG